MVRRRTLITIINNFNSLTKTKQTHLIQKNLYFTSKISQYSKNSRLFFKKFNKHFKFFFYAIVFKYAGTYSYYNIKLFKYEVLKLINRVIIAPKNILFSEKYSFNLLTKNKLIRQELSLIMTSKAGNIKNLLLFYKLLLYVIFHINLSFYKLIIFKYNFLHN